MHFWRKLSIQNKLILSMTRCLLVFVAISSGLSIRLIGNAARGALASCTTSCRRP